MHMIVRSTAYPVGDGRTGTPIWDRVKCSKLEDLPTNPSSWHPCPALQWQLTVTLRWSHPVEPRSTAVHFCLLPFPSLQLRLWKVQSAPLPPSHITPCMHSPPTQSHLCSRTRHTLPHTTGHNHSVRVHPRIPPSEGCSCLPGSTKAGQPGVWNSGPLPVHPSRGPSSTAGWFQSPSAQFLHRGIWALECTCLFGGQG